MFQPLPSVRSRILATGKTLSACLPFSPPASLHSSSQYGRHYTSIEDCFLSRLPRLDATGWCDRTHCRIVRNFYNATRHDPTPAAAPVPIANRTGEIVHGIDSCRRPTDTVLNPHRTMLYFGLLPNQDTGKRPTHQDAALCNVVTACANCFVS